MFQENRSWERERGRMLSGKILTLSFGHERILLKPNKILIFLNHSFAIYEDDTLHALIANQSCSAVSASTTAALACSASPGL